MIGRSLDRLVERASRRVAQRTSRRSFLGRLGLALAGGAAMPLLPVDRTGRLKQAHAQEFAKTAQTTDPTACNYWRYCSSDGYLLLLLRRHLQSVPARLLRLADELDRQLHQPRRQPSLPDRLPGLLRQGLLRAVRLPRHRGRDAGLPARAQQRHHLVLRRTHHGLPLLERRPDRQGVRLAAALLAPRRRRRRPLPTPRSGPTSTATPVPPSTTPTVARAATASAARARPGTCRGWRVSWAGTRTCRKGGTT